MFEEILGACQRLFGSDEIGIYTIGDDDMVRVAAWRGPRAGEVRSDVTPLAESVTGQIIRERRIHHIPDLKAEPNLSPTVRDRVDRLGSASLVYAPMLWEDRGLGSILVVRSPPRPFSDREQALLQTFADQAVIAIQNARLFNEVQARTRDLEELLQQQTATAEVLKVISRSAFDLNLVTATILEAAAKLCRAPLATLHLREGDVCRLVTQFGLPEAFERLSRDNPIPVRYPLHARRPMRAGEIGHYSDAWSDPDYLYKATAKMGGYRAIVVIPMMRENELVGIFSLGRPEPEPFTASQIKLVQTFADQAVIAIENARLFDAVQAKTRDLSEALVYQTGSSNILRVIAASPTDVAPVLKAIVDSACEVCDAYDAAVLLRDGDHLRFSAHRGPIPVGLEKWPLNRDWVAGRAVIHRRRFHVPDLLLSGDEFPDGVEIARRMGHRAILAVPLMREGESIGAIVICRIEAHPFSDKQIAVLQTFADQAVIAIGNVRLFDEVQAKTRELEELLAQQTATADVLKVISRSVFDLNPVLQTLIDTAVRLARGSRGTIWIRKGDVLVASAFHHNVPAELRAYLSSAPRSLDEDDYLSRAARDKTVVHIADLSTQQDLFTAGVRQRVAFGAGLWVPLIRDGETIGVFGVPRDEPIAFSEREIEVVKTFADQAVIAIENARLFEEVQARTRDLSEALQQQTATADVLKVISRSAFDLQAVLDTLTASAARLCEAEKACIFQRRGELYHFVANFGFTDDLVAYARAHPVPPGASGA